MTAPTIPERKAVLRREIRAWLRALPAANRADSSTQLREALTGLDLWRHARAVMLFFPLPDEPDIAPLVEAALAGGKVVCLPRLDPGGAMYSPAQITDPARDLIASDFGVLAPRESCAAHPGKQLDLTLVPGLGFTENGWRLGRGKGHYDRMLPRVGGAKCGICFDGQVVAEMPAEPHDIRLDCILTPTRFIPVGSARV